MSLKQLHQLNEQTKMDVANCVHFCFIVFCLIFTVIVFTCKSLPLKIYRKFDYLSFPSRTHDTLKQKTSLMLLTSVLGEFHEC